MIIYKNSIIGIGEHINDFKDNDMFITFGEELPDSLKEYCCCVDTGDLFADIQAGDILEIDGNDYRITAVGNLVCKNLKALGHATFLFNSSEIAEMPGTVYIEKSDLPELKKGTIIIIKDGV